MFYSFRLRLKWQNDHSKAFLKLGFTELNNKPKYVVCLKVLSAESMKKNKLQGHLETNHPNYMNEPVEFFERKLKSIQGQRSITTSFTAENKLAVYSSYAASYQTAKQKKAHKIGENLLTPGMKEVVKIMIGEKECKKLDAVSLSNNTVKRRIARCLMMFSNRLYIKLRNLLFIRFNWTSPQYSRASKTFCVHSLHQQCNYIRGFFIFQSVEIAYKG